MMNMKKNFIAFIFTLTLMPLSACNNGKLYENKISQLREYVYSTETDDYVLTCYGEVKEFPFRDDGTVGELKRILTFKIIPKGSFNAENKDLSVNCRLNEEVLSAKFEFKPLAVSRYAYVYPEKLPDEEFEATITVDGGSETLKLKSKRRDDLISYSDALTAAKKIADGAIDDYFTEPNYGEIRIRLIENEGYNFWYVGFFDGKTSTSYLVDGLTAEILAIKND